MPFLVYEQSNNELKRVKGVSLGGNQGPFAQHVRKLVEEGKEAPIEWHLTASEMLSYLGIGQPDQQTLIVDLKPNAHNNVSLYRITDVWGHTKTSWTPLGLRLETVFVDRHESNPDEFQKRFQLPSDEGDLVHEFLYLTGGADSDSWGWGMTGNVNAPLLWPETFRYFVEAMTEDLEWGA